MATGDTKRATHRESTAAEPQAGGGKQNPDVADEQRPGGGSGGGKHPAPEAEVEHEGATEAQVGDRGGPGVGFDQEPAKEKDEGGVS